MDSIWLEDDHNEKLYLPAPVTMLNAKVPMLHSQTLELPPLPPTSYFSETLKQPAIKKNKFMRALKKLSGDNDKQEHKPRPKISTPYGFSHISHVDNETPATNRSFEMPRRAPSKPASTMTESSGTGVTFNTTLPTTLPRSTSQPDSLVSSTFTRTSISTMATATTCTRRQTSISHTHTTSASSLEQLAKLEKHQISKQCSVDYSSSYQFPTDNERPDELTNWDTPPRNNAVRQSWVYEFSPVERHQFMEGISPMLNSPTMMHNFPMMHGNSPIMKMSSPNRSPMSNSTKKNVQRFQNEMDGVFENTASDYSKIQKSLDNFKDLFDLGEDVERSEDSNSIMESIQETISIQSGLLPSSLG